MAIELFLHEGPPSRGPSVFYDAAKARMKTESKWKIILVLAVFVVAATLLFESLTTQVCDWHDARLMAREHPYLALVPRPLPTTDTSTEPGTRLSNFGYEYEVPWQAPVDVKRSSWVTAYVFPSERALAFFDSTLSARTMNNLSPSSRQLVSELSGYETARKSLYTTPDQISLFLSREESARRKLLLTIKDLEVPRSVSGVYFFEAPHFRGFQIGSPAADSVVEILCFEGGIRRFRLVFGSKPGISSQSSQQDVNRVIETLQPVAPANEDQPIAK